MGQRIGSHDTGMGLYLGTVEHNKGGGEEGKQKMASGEPGVLKPKGLLGQATGQSENF